MEQCISSQFWSLYTRGEWPLVQQWCELGKALMLLAMSADEQATQLPDCPACEVVSSALEPVQVFVGSYPELLPFDFKQDLQHITELGDGLSKEALQCWNRTIFSSPEWGPIRVKAHVALEKMEWQSLLQPYVDEVLQACRRAT